MKKKSIAARLGVAALALTLVTTSLSSGTLAKYTETFKAQAQLRVASWHVSSKLLKSDGSTEWTAMADPAPTAVQLADTAYTTDLQGDQVKTGYLAPGMSGEFTIDVSAAGEVHNNASDVDVFYQVYILPTSGGAPKHLTMTPVIKGEIGSPLSFASDPADTTLGWLLAEGRLQHGSTREDEGFTKVKVKWEWPYNSSGIPDYDKDDTKDGKNPPTGGYQIAVKFTQANPTAEETDTPPVETGP